MSKIAVAGPLERTLAQFEEFEAAQNVAPWLAHLRRRAIERVAELGFPTLKNEEWRYTNVSGAVELLAGPAAGAQAAPHSNGLAAKTATAEIAFTELKGHRLVFVNGKYIAGLSSQDVPAPGIECRALSEALSGHSEVVQERLGSQTDEQDDVFANLNTAFAQDGAFVRIPGGVTVEEPIILLFLAVGEADAVFHPRNLILIGAGAQAKVIEIYHGEGAQAYLTNSVTEVSVGKNAHLDHVKVEAEGPAAQHLATMKLTVARDAVSKSTCVNYGGKTVRNSVVAVTGGENCEITLNGLVVADGEQHIDNHTTVDHSLPRCASHELYAHVLSGKAHGVFNGKIFVRQDAQKTDAKQSNRSLLLSTQAQMDTKPQLEIFADDVKCTHGATVGQLDEDALFYLRSRGIEARQAQHMLVHAFANEVLSGISDPLLVELIQTQLLTKLS
jgi:Fe-S cluster assembly protein SufD